MSKIGVKYQKLKKKPLLTKKHKAKRLEYATTNLPNGRQFWESIVFSDETKFNLDGPDGLAYYCHDLRREKKFFSVRGRGGGSLMIWTAIGFNGKAKIVVVQGRINSIGYQNILNDHLLPFAQ